MHTASLTVRFCGAGILVASIACSSGSSDPPPAGPAPADPHIADASAALAIDGGPTPSPGNCYPTPSDTGNSKHVGAYCTKATGQCSDFNNTSLQCSSDLSAQGGDFCLLVGCTADSDCGEDSCCTAPVGSPISACIPLGCFEAGVCSPIAP